MDSKNKKQRKGESVDVKGSRGSVDEETPRITDPRFSSAHTDPRFRRIPKRESKVTIDSRFQKVFTDKASAPVDKRGKRKRGGGANDSLREFYRIDEEKKKKNKKREKEDSEDGSGEENESESESEQELMDLKSEAKRRKSEESSEEESKSEKNLGLEVASSDVESDDESAESDEEEEEEEDTDEDYEDMYEDDGPEIEEEDIPKIEKETHRLAIVRMDWRHVSAKDLYVVLNSFVPKDGRILSVSVYPTEFGLKRMKEEEVHGPAIDGCDEEVEDEDVINEKLRDYEKSKLEYYYAVAECDSSATADFLYKSCDGLEFEKSSNKLDLRFIPDSVEFKFPPRDIATEAPANYEGLDFQSRALQMSKVNLSWDEDEPHRIKTLNQKFNPDQLAELELKEFLASDESESDDDYDGGVNLSKKEKKKDKYRALFESEGVDSDKDEEEDENDHDMEVTFNTGLEDLSKQILEKKEKKSETVWEKHLRERREKKRARKNKQSDDSSSPDDDDDDGDYKDDGDDDFFVKEAPIKKKKKEKESKKKKKGLEEEEKSKAELELLLADENAGDGNGPKGYNIKRKVKKGSKEIAEDKIPAVDLDDKRFSVAFSDPHYALDPTDPQFKRSATYARQLAQKQKEDPRSREELKATEEKVKEEPNKDGKLTSVIKSLKLKMQQKDSEKIKAVNADSYSALAKRMKKKAQALSKN